LREQILDTAFKHFARFGYSKTTISSIAEELGKQKSALYYYFKNKEDIFCSIVAVEAENFLTELSVILNGKGNEALLLNNYINHRIRVMYGVAARYSLLKSELFLLLPLIELSRQPFHQKEVDQLAELLNKGVQSGTFRSLDCELNAKVIVNSLKGLEIPMFVKQEFNVDSKEIEAISSLVLNGIKN
jgi:AcrR family transcriptional regulator